MMCAVEGGRPRLAHSVSRGWCHGMGCLPCLAFSRLVCQSGGTLIPALADRSLATSSIHAFISTQLLERRRCHLPGCTRCAMDDVGQPIRLCVSYPFASFLCEWPCLRCCLLAEILRLCRTKDYCFLSVQLW